MVPLHSESAASMSYPGDASTLCINYLILNEPNLENLNVQSVTIGSNETAHDLKKAIESENQLNAGEVEKLEIVNFSLDDEEIEEKLRNFTFTPTTNNWRAKTKLSAIIPADLALDHLHLIVRA